MSEATIEQVRTVARNEETKKHIEEQLQIVKNDFNMETNNYRTEYLRGKIEAYNDILKRLY